MTLLRSSILAFVLTLCLIVPVAAQEPTVDEVNAVARDLNCPTCETRSLDQCNTQTCIQWKEQIRDLMVQGLSKAEILDWYVARYGDYVLQEPPRRGLGLLAWLLPVIGVAGGAVWLGFLLRKWSAQKPKPATAAVAPPQPENDEYLRRVEQELRDL